MLTLTPAQKIALAAIVLLALVAGGLRLTAVCSAGDGEVAYEPPPAPEKLQVHVVGAVTSPGLYSLPVGARVQDAITAAGGFAANARPDSLNLAAFLDDGQQVVVEAAEPVAAATPPPPTAEPPPAAHVVGATGATPPPAPTVSEAAPPAAAGGEQPTLPWSPGGEIAPVCINTAGPEELESLPGIGQELAMRIVYYRHEHGRFRSPQDLLQVPGIGQATLDEVRPYIRLQ